MSDDNVSQGDRQGKARNITYLRAGGKLTQQWDGSDTYEGTDFQAERPTDHGRVASARVELHPPRWQNNFDSGGPWGDYNTHWDYEKPKVGEQGTLFNRKPGEIYAAFAARSMRHTIPTLLGLAAVEHEKQYGDKDAPLPMPSGDLSMHSSSMVHNLKRRGVKMPENPDNPKAEVTNRIDWDNTRWMEDSAPVERKSAWKPGGYTVIPAAQVEAGRERARSVLRPKPLAQQFGGTAPQQDRTRGQAEVPGQQRLF